MEELAFWKAVTVDHADFLEQLVNTLQENKIPYCVIGGVAVNAYTDPVLTLDFDIVIAVDELARAERLLAEKFTAARFAHSLNLASPNSRLRVQIQLDSRYAAFVARATPQEVLGFVLPVATPADLLQGKLWAVQDSERRASKRQKDLADIARLLEEFPELRANVPPNVLTQLIT